MRRAREEMGLDMVTLAQRTRVRVHLLSAVEEGRFDELPRGVYARAVVRAYASAVGIDPNRAVSAVEAMLPGIEDPLDGIARVRGFSRPASTAAEVPRDAPADVAVEVQAPARIERRAAPPAAGDLVARSAAAAIDGLLLSGIGLVLLPLTAWTAEVPVKALLDFAAPALALVFLGIAGFYFLMLGGIGSATVGTRLMRLAQTSTAPPRRLRAVGWRAWIVAARELSILVDVLLPMLRAPGGRPGVSRSGTRWAGRATAP